MTSSSTSGNTSSERATQEEFDKEVQRVQLLINHIQRHAIQLKEADATPQEAAEKLQEAEELLERAEELLEETRDLQE